MSSFYITTPIYYVNDAPHLGHAYTTIAADALARFHRAIGDDTRFLTGTDEHGQKVEEAARSQNLTPQALADSVVERFRATWVNLDIQNDDFIRTTESRHKVVVAELWRRMKAKGDIYLDSYQGWYCVACEAFYPESQLEGERLCPVHKREATWVSEPSYFFRMSKYQEPLLRHFEQNPAFVAPENYQREVVSFIKSGLRDLSVSRTSFTWGIPVPDDEKHVIYVWIDALSNYVSALGEVGGERYRRFWPGRHLIGKDILRFHAVYWPCMLMSAGLPLPRQVFTHGWWTVRGEKISKSMPATRVDPNRIAADIGADALRYFLLREIPLGNDGDFSYEALIGRYNSDLANDLGNLFGRCTTMAIKFTEGLVPAQHPEMSARGAHADLARVAAESIRQAREYMLAIAPARAIEAIWRLVREANRYVDGCQPWTLSRNPSQRVELEHCLHTMLEATHCVARMVAPVMPRTGRAMLVGLGLSPAAVEAALSRWPDDQRFGSELTPGGKVEKGEALFPRLGEEKAAELLSRWIPQDVRNLAPQAPSAQGAAAAVSSADAAVTVTIEEFSRLDLRVGIIEAAEPIPKAQKLLKLTVSLGSEGTRQVVAGLAEAYPPGQLLGRRVIFLANLKPATIRGVRSEGMVLAAGEKEVIGLSALDRELPAGTRIR
jgi:methionyl-tRNA synthetase